MQKLFCEKNAQDMLNTIFNASTYPKSEIRLGPHLALNSGRNPRPGPSLFRLASFQGSFGFSAT